MTIKINPIKHLPWYYTPLNLCNCLKNNTNKIMTLIKESYKLRKNE